MNRFIITLHIFFVTTLLQAKIITYHEPENIKESPRYKVIVSQNGESQKSFVYYTESQGGTGVPLGYTTSFTTFSFSGEVTITITRLDGKDIQNCVIRPLSYNITPKIEGSSVSYTIRKPRKVSVEFEADLTQETHKSKTTTLVKHAMLVFADPLETFVPNKEDKNVIYFEPGVHEIGTGYSIPNNTTVYFAGGAYVKGCVKVENGKNIKVLGRGILSGEGHKWRSHQLMKFVGIETYNVVVEGITLINSAHYNLSMEGSHDTIRNVKMISWYGRTDGTHGPEYGLLEDCFFKVNDDAIKLYRSNSVVRRNTIWIQTTGAPFQFAWNMTGIRENVHVYDCDVIHCEWRVDHLNRGVFNSVAGGDVKYRNFLLEDIRVEGEIYRVAFLHMKKTQFSPQKDYGEFSDITFKNILVEGPVLKENIIRGAKDTYGPDSIHYFKNITFDSLIINGKHILSAEEGNFKLDPETTQNIIFK